MDNYNKAIQVDSKYADAYIKRSSIYALSFNYKQAIKDLTTAIKLDPQNANAYYFRGACYTEIGDKTRAEMDFAKAKQLGYVKK